MRYSNYYDGVLDPEQITIYEIEPGDLYGLQYVAKIYEDGSWSVFVDPPEEHPLMSVKYGEIVSESIAEFLFPTLAFNREYRTERIEDGPR